MREIIADGGKNGQRLVCEAHLLISTPLFSGDVHSPDGQLHPPASTFSNQHSVCGACKTTPAAFDSFSWKNWEILTWLSDAAYTVFNSSETFCLFISH